MSTKKILALTFINVLLTSNNVLAQTKITYYEPAITTLFGIIHIKDSPGPPNYNNSNKDHAKVTGYYVILDKNIDVQLPPIETPENGMDEPEENIKTVQLVINHRSDWTKLKENNHVRITSTLFHWFSGHHHTKVLMSVNEVKLLHRSDTAISTFHTN